jgi:raffinose/stachyose/melibiose transport system substrate-binding protein
VKKPIHSLLLVAVVVAATGCQSVANTPPPTASAAAESAASTAATAATPGEVVTVKVLDAITEKADTDAVNQIVQLFETAHPDIKIERTSVGGKDLDAMAMTTMASAEGPDIIARNPGPGFAGVMARAGLLLPLDDYWKKYNWDDRIYPIAKSQGTIDGHIYGIPTELEFIGVFYNKTLFDKLGLAVPKTYDDLIDICHKATAAGYIPLAFANKDQWEADVQYAQTISNMIGREGLDNILHGDGRWDTPESTKAIQIPFVDMVKAGCYEADPNAVAWEDGNTLFYSQKALMVPTGTWLIGDINTNVKDFEPGFFFYPTLPGGKGQYPAAGLGGGYWVSAKSKHPDQAAQWLDFFFSPESAKIWMEGAAKIQPVKVDSSGFNLNPLFKFAVNALATQSDQMGYNIDPLLPANFNQTELDGFQAVVLGQKTPEQMAKDLQKDWEDALAKGDAVK